MFTRPALALERLGVTPNMLIVAGAALFVMVTITLLPKGHSVAGPPVLLVALVISSLDGIPARATGKSSVFGTFLDFTMDRLADGAVLEFLTAQAILSMPVDALRTMTVAAALVAAVMAATVPYVRAWTESIGVTTSVGIAKRTDRLLVTLGSTFLMGLGAPQRVLAAGLVYVVIASFITVIQRARAVHRRVRQGDEKA